MKDLSQRIALHPITISWAVRTLLPFTLAGLAGFGAGYAVTLFGRRETAEAEKQPAASSIIVAEPVAKKSRPASSAAGSKERIATVLAMGEKQRGLAEDHALFVAISKLTAPDFLAGGAELLALFKKGDSPFGSPNLALAEAWMERWLEVDVAAALRFIGSSTSFIENPPGMSLRSRASSVQGGIFAVLARRQPGWTQQYLAALKPGPQRDVGVFQLLKECAQQNAAKSREVLASFSEGANRPAAVQGYVTGLTATDVRAGFDVAAAEPAGPFRKELLEVVFHKAAERGIGVVRELLDCVDDAELRRDLAADSALELSWRSRDDPLPWLMEEAQRTPLPAKSKGEFDRWTSYVTQALATSGNVARAADWAATIANDPEKELLLGLLGRWDQRDDAGLRSWLASHADALNTSVLEKLGRTITDMARRDGIGTRAWAAALPHGPLREQAQFQIALSSGAEGDLAPAAAAYASVAGSDTSGALAKQLATILAKQDGSESAKWAMAMPNGPARAAAMAAVAEQWSQRDPRGAAEWLAQMPPGAERDSAVREYAAKVVYADPRAGAEWVEQVADPAARAKAAESVFWTWNHEDPIASRAWLRALPGVTETWRADFLRKVE